MSVLILSLLSAFTLTYLLIPVILRRAKEKALYSIPNSRSVHKVPTPALGGIAIFAGVFSSVVLWTPEFFFAKLQYILAAFLAIFLIGLKDDLMPVSPVSKLLIQLLAAWILTAGAGVQIASFYGAFGIYDLPYWAGMAFSILVITGLVNAFNLIDGIDGLAGGVGLMAAIALGLWFHWAGQMDMAVIAASMTGALLAFLRFNLTPARIFMGDTGSMFIGLTSALLAIKFMHSTGSAPRLPAIQSAPAWATGILAYPILDTLYAIFRRTLLGKSPFAADKKHIHHALLDCGFTHLEATAVLLGANVVLIAFTISLDFLGTNTLLGLQLGLSSLGIYLLIQIAEKKQRTAPKSGPAPSPERLVEVENS